MKRGIDEEIEIISQYKREVNEVKLVFLWFLGTLFIFIASWLAGHIEWVYGTTTFSFWFSIALSFLLFMTGSFLWIVVSVLINQMRD